MLTHQYSECCIFFLLLLSFYYGVVSGSRKEVNTKVGHSVFPCTLDVIIITESENESSINWKCYVNKHCNQVANMKGRFQSQLLLINCTGMLDI